MTTLTYEDLKAEFRLSSSGDTWGEVMGWWFSIADEIWFNRDRLEVPESWQFRPSPLGQSNEPDSYETECVEGASDDALMRFGLLMDRYASKLNRAGMDY